MAQPGGRLRCFALRVADAFLARGHELLKGHVAHHDRVGAEHPEVPGEQFGRRQIREGYERAMGSTSIDVQIKKQNTLRFLDHMTRTRPPASRDRGLGQPLTDPLLPPSAARDAHRGDQGPARRGPQELRPAEVAAGPFRAARQLGYESPADPGRWGASEGSARRRDRNCSDRALRVPSLMVSIWCRPVDGFPLTGLAV